MEMNATAAAAIEPSRVSGLLRRVGMMAGFSFGFLLLGLALAGEANASEEAEPGSLDQVAGSLDKLVTPLSQELSVVTAPVEEIVTSTVAEPVVTPLAEAAEPVVTPLADAVAPVTEPVLTPVSTVVEPVVESVSPLVEPITEPILGAGESALDPVAEAVGVEPVVSALEPEATPTVPGRPTDAQPVPPPELESTLEQRFSVQAVAPDTAMAGVDASSDDLPGHWSDKTRPDLPHGPFWPSGELAVGVSGLAASTSGSHAADSAVTTGWPTTPAATVAYRGPPYADVMAQWHGYDDRDHPG